MRKKLIPALLLAVAVAGIARKATAEVTKPKYFLLSIDFTGHIWCYQDGSDCKVGS